MRPAGYSDVKMPRSKDRAQTDRRRTAWRVRYLLIAAVALTTAVGLLGWHFWGGRGEVLKHYGGPVVTVVDFGRNFPLDPPPSGWRHQEFWTRSPMTMALTVKDGVPSMRFETHDSASMRFATSRSISPPIRCSLGLFIELPIRSPLDERTRVGDDHPARLFLRLITDRGEKRAKEVIWGNRLQPGDYKYISSFLPFVADAGDDRVGRWLDERIDLACLYAEIWKDAAPPTWSCRRALRQRRHAYRQHQLLRLCPTGTAVRLGQTVAGTRGRLRKTMTKTQSSDHCLVFGRAGPHVEHGFLQRQRVILRRSSY